MHLKLRKVVHSHPSESPGFLCHALGQPVLLHIYRYRSSAAPSFKGERAVADTLAYIPARTYILTSVLRPSSFSFSSEARARVCVVYMLLWFGSLAYRSCTRAISTSRARRLPLLYNAP